MPEKVPRLVTGVDFKKLKLDPTDGFLLTRIDGRSSAVTLARETGLPDFTVVRALEKLEKLGVIEIVEPGAPPKAAPPPPSASKKPELPTFGPSLTGPKYDPKELEEEAEISLDVKKRILDLYYRLDDLDHYMLLGIPREADKKAVKRAYFELAATMHPDKYFNKKLGSFKGKMEALFGRTTEAHDTLVDAQKRADYDAYLTEIATTQGMEALLERAIWEAQKTTPQVDFSMEASVPPPAISSAPAPPAAPARNEAAELQARREALARRLLGGKSIKPPPAAPNPQAYKNSTDAVDALKRRYEARVEDATASQARKYATAGEEALAKNDLVAAASALGIALKFTPNDPELAARHAEVKERADNQLVESYTKQATYEEKNGHYPEAAKTWLKVVKIRPGDVRARQGAAHSLLHAPDADMHEAAEHAKRAVALEPTVAAHHVTLAEIYTKAGLVASAKKAAELGLQHAPDHKTLLAILKQKPLK